MFLTLTGCSNESQSEIPICRVENCDNECFKYRIANSWYYTNCCQEHKCVIDNCNECIELDKFGDGKHCVYHKSKIDYQEENKIKLTDSQIQEATKTVEEYCKLLMSEQTNIKSINFIGDNPEIGTIYIMYHCNVVREDSDINPATIYITINNDGSFKVQSLDYNKQ